MAYREHNFSLRLTPQEFASYERLASENGVSVSEWMREVLNREVRYKEETASKRREGETINHFYERVVRSIQKDKGEKP